jgi:DNA invertase Pin-like site-specific DNA recombinase
MLGVFAEFETNLRRERQAEGIAKKKREGGYKGRLRTIDRAMLAKLRSEGSGATEIARPLSVCARSAGERVIGGA